jgi:hypothetical protein
MAASVAEREKYLLRDMAFLLGLACCEGEVQQIEDLGWGRHRRLRGRMFKQRRNCWKMRGQRLSHSGVEIDPIWPTASAQEAADFSDELFLRG